MLGCRLRRARGCAWPSRFVGTLSPSSSSAPPWGDAAAADWTSSPVAQFRYQPTSKLWALYWPDRNTRWHLFAEAPPTADIGKLAHAVSLDATGIFWG